MGVILQGSGNSDAPAKSIEREETWSQGGETPLRATIEWSRLRARRIEEKKPFATPVLTSVEMMQIDDGKNFKAFLEGETENR